MRKIYTPLDESDWFDHFMGKASQSGHGMDGFIGMPYQRGHGLGSFFKGLFRMLLPVAKKIGKSVGKQALVAGSHIAADAVRGRNIKESLKKHGRNATANFMEDTAVLIRQPSATAKQSGAGRKRKLTEIIKTPNKKQKMLDAYEH